MAFNLDTCRSKDEMETFAKEMFGVDLDKRKKMDELKKEIQQLIAGKDDTAPQVEAVDTKEVNFVKNSKGVIFPYHPQLHKRVGVDLMPCDKNGD